MEREIKLSAPHTGDFWKIPIVYEDDQLLAIAKPTRLLTSPDRYDPDRPNIIKLLHRDIERGAAWVRERGISYLANAHRLDFETTGVLLLVKNKTALIAVANQFGSNLPVKTYLALVQGHPPSKRFDVDQKIGAHPLRLGHMRIDPKEGKKAETGFLVEEEFRSHTWLRCLPLTGRTHQIRIHLKHVHLPTVGDTLYGGHPLHLSSLKPNYVLKKGKQEKPLLDRVALHASELRLAHPGTGAPVVITAPLPKDLVVALKYLRKFTAQPSLALPSAMGEEADESEPEEEGDDQQ